jgi:hypothetical protein
MNKKVLYISVIYLDLLIFDMLISFIKDSKQSMKKLKTVAQPLKKADKKKKSKYILISIHVRKF